MEGRRPPQLRAGPQRTATDLPRGVVQKNGGPASADAIAGVLHAGGARAQWARSDYGATYETSSPLRALFFYSALLRLDCL